MIYFRTPGVPLSVNHAYETFVTRKGKRSIPVRRLTDAGKKYKMELKTFLLQNHPQVLSYLVADRPYALLVKLTFRGREKLYNKTWDPGNENSSVDRYKRLDVSNRIKLFEDALSEATGLDDKHNFFLGAYKSWSSTDEYTEAWVSTLDGKDNPIDVLIRELSRVEPH